MKLEAKIFDDHKKEIKELKDQLVYEYSPQLEQYIEIQKNQLVKNLKSIFNNNAEVTYK